MLRKLFTFVILLICTFVIHNSVWGRRPAVEPIVGLSIDEYEHVPPEKAKGYTFTQGQSKPQIPKKTDLENEQINQKNNQQKNLHPPHKTLEQKPSKHLGTWGLLSFLILLPAMIGIVIYRAINTSKKSSKSFTSVPENVTDLMTYQEKEKAQTNPTKNKTKDGWPKAS